ncbi:MAG: hypothetical protein AAGC54_03320 [Cyanobacteria bacterium P01_F01_bin.4]
MEYTALNSLSSNRFGTLLNNNSHPSRARAALSDAPAPPSLDNKPVGCANEAHITHAIVSVIQAARLQGQSLEEVMDELMADDALLDSDLRRLLGDVVAQAWEKLP